MDALPPSEAPNELTLGLDALDAAGFVRALRSCDAQLFAGWHSHPGLLDAPLLESAELQGDEYGCSEERHDRRDLLEPKPRGVNLGGWLVLEPWVTPSLFYQFEGRPANETAMDMHGFCRVLGAQEANRQLRIHWEKWVTEEHLAELASRGINALRVPVGDWMWTPYWPYHGCADGAVAVTPAGSTGVGGVAADVCGSGAAGAVGCSCASAVGGSAAGSAAVLMKYILRSFVRLLTKVLQDSSPRSLSRFSL